MSKLLLGGCSFQPLASYLKGLGVFRLVSMQADPNATGWWSQIGFELESGLDRERLIRFFLDCYRPTPVLAPWNGGSGFYPKDRKVGIEAITSSQSERFSLYRNAIAIAGSIVGRGGGAKSAAKSDEDKRREAILRLCRNELPDLSVDWLDAAIAISAEGSRAFAPILGTGGNEGRLDYTNNFMENCANLLLEPSSKKAKTPIRELLENAIFDTPATGLQDIAVGQYDPGRAGGFNQGQGIESSAIANPWSVILTVEGAIVWAGGIYRKQGVSYRSFLCSPFTVRPSAAGYTSATSKDRTAARAEVWAPLWNRFTKYDEVRGLFREGRAALGEKPAQNGLEFAEAIASLGVDRGISGFIRYSMLKRRGDSYIAPPLGRFEVHYRNGADLIRQITNLLDRAEYSARNGQKDVPNSWPPLRRAIEEAAFTALMQDTDEKLVEVAAAFGAAVRWFFERRIKTDFGKLDSAWVRRCADTCAEAGIAASLASLPEIVSNLHRGDDVYSWTGRDVSERMLNTLRRRVLGSSAGASPGRHRPVREQPARLEDVARFLDGELRDQYIEDLLFAFTQVKPLDTKPDFPKVRTDLWPVYCVMKLLFLNVNIKTRDKDVSLAPDLAIPSLLSAGRVREAAAVAVRRLRASGLRPLEVEYGDVANPKRLGAGLLIPIEDYGSLVRAVTVDT